MFKNTRLTSRKLYLVNVGPNSNEKLTNNYVGVGPNIAQNDSSNKVKSRHFGPN